MQKSNNQEEVTWGKSSLDKGRSGPSEETRSVRNYYRGEYSGKGTVNAVASPRTERRPVWLKHDQQGAR